MSTQQSAPKMTPQQQNASARSLIYNRATPILQKVGSKTFTNVASGNNTFVVQPFQVGFLKRFLVEVTATVSNTAAGALTLTGNGADNLLSNVTFADFTGNPRHNASGRAFSLVEATKYRRNPGAALTSDSVSGFGSNIASNVAPANIAVSTSGTVTRVFEIPIMQDNGMSMAGGLWLGVNNQSTLLTLTLNDAFCGATGADPLTYGYLGNAAATISDATVTVYQEYWNNVPLDNRGNPILPQADLQTAYMIMETASGLTFNANQTSYWSFPTFSRMLSTFITYDNNGALNAGTDVSLIQAVVANRSVIREYDPITMDRIMRDTIGCSLPDAVYGFVTRTHPFDVSQYPSLQFAFTPSSATSAYGIMTTELLRQVQYLGTASGMGSV